MNTPAPEPSSVPFIDRSSYARSPADRYLPLLFTASILLHELLLLWFMGSPASLNRNSAADGNIPIEFVEVDPQQQVESSPQTESDRSDRIGIGNSEAGEVIRSASLDASPQKATRTDSTAENSDFFQEDPSFQKFQQNDREHFQDTAEYARSQISPEQHANPSAFQEDRVDRSKPKSPRLLDSPDGTESILSSDSPLGTTDELFPAPTPHRVAPASGAGIVGGKGQIGSHPENLLNLPSSSRSSQNDRSGSGNGADARQDVDLAPYLANLKRQVESQWLPEMGNQSSTVVVTFSISRTGAMSNLSIVTGSGRSYVDRAAIDAVQRAASSFGALPPGYSRNSLDIEFTFSITVGQPNVLY